MSRRGSGADSAFEALVLEHRQAVLTYCARRATRADAWDAASEVFLVAWRRFDDVPSEPEVRSWLIGVAYKVLANQRRSAGRRRRLVERIQGAESMGMFLSDEPVVAKPVDDELMAAFSRLRSVDREVLQLALWEELSREDIALALGISIEAVHKRYSRAKQRLGDELAEKSASKGRATQVTTGKEGGTP